MQAGLGDDVDLNGGVTARVVHGASVDLGDRHVDLGRLMKDNQSVAKKRKRRKEKREL